MKLEASIVKKMKGFTLDVNLSAAQGEIVGLLGESGGGKSMTLKSIAGILTPDSGRIVLNDHVLFVSVYDRAGKHLLRNKRPEP